MYTLDTIWDLVERLREFENFNQHFPDFQLGWEANVVVDYGMMSSLKN